DPDARPPPAGQQEEHDDEHEKQALNRQPDQDGELETERGGVDVRHVRPRTLQTPGAVGSLSPGEDFAGRKKTTADIAVNWSGMGSWPGGRTPARPACAPG